MKAPHDIESAVLSVLDRFSMAYADRDVARLRATFAADADVLVYGTGTDEKCIGLAEIERHVERDWAQSEKASVTLDWTSVSSAGAVAWVASEVTFHVTAGGSAATMTGRLTAVLEQRTEGWLVVQAHFLPPLSGINRGPCVSRAPRVEPVSRLLCVTPRRGFQVGHGRRACQVRLTAGATGRSWPSPTAGSPDRSSHRRHQGFRPPGSTTPRSKTVASSGHDRSSPPSARRPTGGLSKGGLALLGTPPEDWKGSPRAISSRSFHHLSTSPCGNTSSGSTHPVPANGQPRVPGNAYLPDRQRDRGFGKRRARRQLHETPRAMAGRFDPRRDLT
ncbi:MAG: nuclear transport factor 2 family protein [Verrucomicrobia bacterium]|nr:nuclear transport factor 2 family protein [Verrucomicrobiota bacterium]